MTTREQWLTSGIAELTGWFCDRASVTIPDVRVSVGFPAGSRGGRNHAIGQCWGANNVSDGRPAIFISPTIDDSIVVLATLTHELVHATVGTQCGHRGEFARVARAVGLGGKLTATVAGEELTAHLTEVADRLGDYRDIHGRIDPSERKKQGTRMILNQCPICGAKFRAARSMPIPICDGDTGENFGLTVHEAVRCIRDGGETEGGT